MKESEVKDGEYYLVNGFMFKKHKDPNYFGYATEIFGGLQMRNRNDSDVEVKLLDQTTMKYFEELYIVSNSGAYFTNGIGGVIQYPGKSYIVSNISNIFP